MTAVVAMDVDRVVLRVHCVAQDLADTVHRRRRAGSLLVPLDRNRDVLNAVLAYVGGKLVVKLLVLEVVVVVEGAKERSALHKNISEIENSHDRLDRQTLEERDIPVAGKSTPENGSALDTGKVDWWIEGCQSKRARCNG